MTLFKMIGGDGQTYGPVEATLLREWIAQGRVNAATLVQTEGSPDWKPLSAWPEFAGASSARMVPPVIPGAVPAKSKVVAGILGILLGSFGVHRFYLGYTGIGLAQLLLTVLSCGALWIGTLIWGVVEGVLILCGSGITTDAEGRPLTDT